MIPNAHKKMVLAKIGTEFSSILPLKYRRMHIKINETAGI